MPKRAFGKIIIPILAISLAMTACGQTQEALSGSGFKFEEADYDAERQNQENSDASGSDVSSADNNANADGSGSGNGSAGSMPGNTSGSGSVSTSGQAIDETYVNILNGTDKDMLSADYWINLYYAGGGSSQEIMTPSEIQEMNVLNESLIAVDGFEPFTQMSLVDTMDGKLVRALVDCVEAPKDPSTVYLNGQPTTAAYWKELKKLQNLEAIPDTVTLRYGYSVDRRSLRSYPTNDFVGNSKTDEFFDQLVMSEYMPYLPLVIIHESADKEWMYVVTYGFVGWVESEYVALCHDRGEWLSYMNPEEVLVVTGREIRLPDVQGDERISGLILPMGTTMPLVKVEDAPKSIHGRTTHNNYVVRLKVRGKDGYLEETYGLVAVAEDVHVGFLPYTTENVLRQEFKLLGDRYGWAGLGHSDDCSGTLRMVYCCFGFEIPRTGGGQIAMKGLKHFDLEDMGDDEKSQVLKGMLPGSFVFFPGHIMMYVGTVNSEAYVISSVSTFATLDMADGDIMSSNTVDVNNLLKTKRKSGKSWLASLTQALQISK